MGNVEKEGRSTNFGVSLKQTNKKKPNKSDILSKTKQQENGLLETTSGLR